MVSARAADGAAIARTTQELEAGAGKALGQATVMPAAAGLPPQPPAMGTAASQARPYKVMPRSAAWTPRADTFALAARGYAGASAASKTKAAKTASSKTTSAKSTSGKSTSAKSAASKELAFLDDPALSIQDKLYQFMALQMKKSNRELKEAMQEYEGKRAQTAKQKAEEAGTGGASGGSSVPAGKSSGGGGLFGMLGDALGGIPNVVVGGAESLAKDLGGPLLAAGCTAVGLPFLAPIALQIGGPIGKAAVGGVASMVGGVASSLLGGSSQGVGEALLGAGSGATSGGASASGSASTSKASSARAGSTSAVSGGDDFDERVEAMNLQRLIEKQQAMFGILSNALKAMHDTQMNAIQNMR